ncbi:right-handed parallel beta-helix repeat-containing protein [Azospirillum sp. YIM B02556]|uniref:Right-handed parallel beta-helix repeat-containing protein n=1 Tax=Azospirillum endophyticum TaxID=2800326 RepID=A0ABS1F4C4_9PROT|nr:carbohydrate-binding domain-containing protein [Azospirillum endophyticum]MBK1838259.1 right-handed parallel beta-helix repeat-containing protein [Azospirillum endophyticum]
MATTNSDGTIQVTFAVNAWGMSADGKWPHFQLLLDGTSIGEATVASATQSRYVFTANVPADKAHALQLVYDNDDTVNGEDRNLFVKSFEVNGKTILSIDPSVKYDTGKVDGLNVIAGQTEMYWPGALNVPLPATLFPSAATVPDAEPAASMTTTIKVSAYGNSAAGQAPHFKLLVDDQVVGDAWVSATSPTDYSFTAKVDPNEAHKIQIWYDNDATVNGVDRNLFVKSINIDGKTIASTSDMASYDKGPVDGKFVVAGQEGLFWGGALTFGVPEEYFGGAYVPPPPPPPSKSVDIVVNAYGTSAGGQAAHFKLLVDGQVIGDAKAAATTTGYKFTADIDPTKAHTVQVWYDNDATVNGVDRNLFVKSVSINGHTVAATDSIVTYDKGAVDGKDVVKGQEGLYWGGALNIKAGVDLFSNTPSTQTPVPTAPTKPAFYVAANGKDSWSGKLSAPNADGTDGPFASLEKAQAAMRANPAVDTTYVREGTYHLAKTLELTALDNGHSFQNYPGEKPVLSGGEVVKGFTSEGNGLYSAKLGSASNLDLIVGDVRQHLAEKFAYDASDVTSGWHFADAASGGPSGWSIRSHGTDVTAADIQPGTLIQIMDAERLGDTLGTIASFNASTRTIMLKNGASLPFAEGTTYKLLNNAAYVDQAGEFAWRASDGKLLYKAASSGFASTGVEVPRLDTLIKLNGANNVTIDGLTFKNTTTGGDALLLTKSSGNHISDNSFLNVGTAIKLTAASSNNQIAHNTLNHLAENGIEMDGRSNGNSIYANSISNIGEVRKAVSGIFGTGVDNNVISNNDIDHSARYGISFKDYGGTTDTVNHNNVVQYNNISYTGLETADGGAIEVLGRSSANTGMIIQGNRIEHANGLATSAQDSWMYGQKGFGIYLDDMAGGITVKDNFIKDADWASVQIHGGDNNVVTNNFAVIASNKEDFIRIEWQPVHGTAGDPHNNTITKNVVMGTLPLDDYMELLSANDFVIDNNLVYNVPKYGDHDVIAKPMFTNAYWGDYSLQASSPAFAMGIHDLAWAKMGAEGVGLVGLEHFWDGV